MKGRVILITLIIACLFLCCRGYTEKEINNILENGYIKPDSEMESLLKELDKKQDKKMYGSLASDENRINTEENSTEIPTTEKSFNFGVVVDGFSEYKEYSDTEFKEISQYSTRNYDIQFIGFSNDSKFVVYRLGKEYYVLNLYEEKEKNSIVYKNSNIELVNQNIESGVQELRNLNTSINDFFKKNLFWFRVDLFSSQTKKGFYISIYDINTKYEFTIFSRIISNIDEMGKINNFEIIFSPDNSWAMIHPFFSSYEGDYGFILINVKKQYSKLLKKEAINKYKEKSYEEALLRYRQSIFLYPGSAEMYYDCAVLIKLLKKENYKKFAEMSISLNPDKFQQKAIDNGLLVE